MVKLVRLVVLAWRHLLLAHTKHVQEQVQAQNQIGGAEILLILYLKFRRLFSQSLTNSNQNLTELNIEFLQKNP